MKRHLSVLLLGLIVTVSVCARFTNLGVIPPGLTDDEANKGYDAYSLLTTGKDQWGVSWPLFAFKGFGDYRTPLYTYLAIFPVKAFGLTPFAVRFPSALFGTLTVVATYLLVKELFRGDGQGIVNSKRNNSLLFTAYCPMLSAALLAISPWHIGMSRMAMEVTVSVFLVTLGMYLLLLGRSRVGYIVFSGLVLALSVYTYPANIILVPAASLLIVFIFRDSYGKKQYRGLAFAAGAFLLLSLPVVVGNTAAPVRVGQVNLTNDSGIIVLLNEKRGACQATLPRVVCRAVLNKYSVYAQTFVSNYLNHFSPGLLAISGTHTQFSILPERGLLYVVELPLLILGIYAALRKKLKAGMFAAVFLLVAALPDSVTSAGHYGRFFVSLPAWQILTALGILELSRWILPFLLAVYLLEAAHFGVSYSTYFPYRYSEFSHYGYRELVDKIESYKRGYDKVILSSSVNDAKQYIFYLFYRKFDPQTYQKGTEIEKGQDALGWVRVKRLNSLYFVPDLPNITDESVYMDRELFIAHPSEFPKQTYIPAQFVVKDKKGDILFQAVDVRDYIRCVTNVCKPL